MKAQKISSTPRIRAPFSSRNSMRSSVLNPESRPFNRLNMNFQYPITNYGGTDIESFLGELPKFDLLLPDTFLANTQEYFTCALCVVKQRYRSTYSLDNHVASKLHRHNLAKLREAILCRPPARGSLQMNSIKELVMNWNKTVSDYSSSLMKVATDDFTALLKVLEPHCSLRLTGSFFMDIPTEDSDINFELIHPNTRICGNSMKNTELIDPNATIGSQFNSFLTQCDLIPNAVNSLFKIGSSISNGAEGPFRLISSLKDLGRGCPRLVVEHTPTKVNIEISCYSGSHYQLAEFLKLYLHLDERAISLATLVKRWAKICKIDDPEAGSLHKVAFTVLVVYFLQRTSPPVLPYVQELIDRNTRPCQNSDLLGTQNWARLIAGGQLLEKPEQTAEMNGTDSFDKTSDEDVELNDVDNGNDREDDQSLEFTKEDFLNIGWISQNDETIEELFIGFFRFMMYEIDKLDCGLISIRTKARAVHKFRWCNQSLIRSIEHPLKPRTVLTSSLRSSTISKYIVKCFEQAFYYLTCLPLDSRLQLKYQRNPDPKTFATLYVHTDRILSYLDMISSSNRFNTNFESIDEMIEQKLFHKDVDTIFALVKHLQDHSLDFSLLPKLVANKYQLDMFRPDGFTSTEFCRLCRKLGHRRQSCPEGRIMTLHGEAQSYDFEFDDIANLDEAFLHEFKMNTISDVRRSKCRVVLNQLTELINSQLNLDCRLELYGSTVNDLGTNSSDLDICLTLKDHPTDRDLICRDILEQISYILTKCQDVCHIHKVFSARVPIIKFNFRGFLVDLSMYNQCAIYNSRLLKEYSQIDNRVSPLVFVVRKFAKIYGIADASQGTLSSYAWCLMVIYYLQNTNPPVLPVLQDQPGGGTPERMEGVCGWNVWFRSASEVKMRKLNTSSLTTLVKHFYIFYSNFDFSQDVVCIRKSRPITKFMKDWSNCIMAIEDPFILTHNLSRQLDESMAIYIMNSFATIYKHIVKMQTLYEERKKPLSMIMDKAMWERYYITPTQPPYRGCKFCHKIGHNANACPEGNSTNNDDHLHGNDRKSRASRRKSNN